LAYRDTTNENREFWKNEMGQALRDIQQVYDDKLDATRNDVETYYNLKVRLRLRRFVCLWGVCTIQQTSSKLPANVFKIHVLMLDVCWMFAGLWKHLIRRTKMSMLSVATSICLVFEPLSTLP